MVKNLGVSNICYEDLKEQAESQEKNWDDVLIPTRCGYFGMLPDGDFEAPKGPAGEFYRTDISQNAFEQYCSLIGVPSAYASKCFENGEGELARLNFDHWQKNLPEKVLVRMYSTDTSDLTVKAVLSNRFTPVSNSRVFDMLDDTVDFNRYRCNQAYLSEEKMHLRFVDFDPLPIGDRMYAGFTVSNNEIGRGAISIKFFLYRFACKNGIVRAEKSGTLFRQKHLGFSIEDEIEFKRSLDDIEYLRQNAVTQILEAQKKNLSVKEIDAYLERVRKELHLGKVLEIEKMPAAEWINDQFGSNLWGVINFVTQKAQEYTLDNRLEMEQYAGRLLAAA